MNSESDPHKTIFIEAIEDEKIKTYNVIARCPCIMFGEKVSYTTVFENIPSDFMNVVKDYLVNKAEKPFMEDTVLEVERMVQDYNIWKLNKKEVQNNFFSTTRSFFIIFDIYI